MIDGGWSFGAIGAIILEALSREEAKPVLEEARKEAIKHTRVLWQGFQWSRAEEQYRQRLLPFVRTTRLLGNPRPVEIDTLYTDLLVYDQVSAHLRSAVLTNPKADTLDIPENSERHSALAVVETHCNLYLLGQASASRLGTHSIAARAHLPCI